MLELELVVCPQSQFFELFVGPPPANITSAYWFRNVHDLTVRYPTNGIGVAEIIFRSSRFSINFDF